MSTKIVITKNIINYISANGYRSDPIIDELIKETKKELINETNKNI